MTVEVFPAHAADRDEVVRLFAEYPLKTWQKRVQGIDPHRLSQLLWDQAEPLLEKPGAGSWIAWRDRPHTALGFAQMGPHPWHSEVFGRRMGRLLHFVNYLEPEAAGPVLLDAVLEKARATGIEHLAARVDGQDWANVHLLESRGFRCVDLSLKLARRLDNLPSSPPLPANLEIRPYEPADLDALQQIAARSHTHNHFYNDPSLSRDRAAALFQEWLARCARGLAAFVLVAVEGGGRVVGFVTALENKTLARVVGVAIGIIDYIVVDRSASGRGIGRALLDAALRRLARDNTWVELRTSQDNYRAAAFYSAAGFSLVGSDFVLHRWETKTGK
ncbi:MAG: GNAT family N-acetyltransferase [Candidatus Sumerlaeia bacterium]|nr:GNAT family N-acetyltransferase [Candidatus Sumerlaeia bacterium]